MHVAKSGLNRDFDHSLPFFEKTLLFNPINLNLTGPVTIFGSAQTIEPKLRDRILAVDRRLKLRTDINY